MSAKRKLFVPLKEKDIDTQGTNRKHMFEELKKTVPNGCCTSFYARDYETDVSSEVPVASNANLLTKLATTCKSVGEFLSQMPVPPKHGDRQTMQRGLISAKAESQHQISTMVLPELIPSRLTIR